MLPNKSLTPPSSSTPNHTLNSTPSTPGFPLSIDSFSLPHTSLTGRGQRRNKKTNTLVGLGHRLIVQDLLEKPGDDSSRDITMRYDMLVRQAITSAEGSKFNLTNLIPTLLIKARDWHNSQLSDSINQLKKDLEAKARSYESRAGKSDHWALIKMLTSACPTTLPTAAPRTVIT